MASLVKSGWRKASRLALSNNTLRRATRGAAHRGYLPRSLWKRLPITEPTFEVGVDNTDRFRYHYIDGDAIGFSLYWQGLAGWETETLGAFRNLAKNAKFFVDVGANTGAYTLLFLAVSPEGEAIAYEPVPRVAAALEDNIACNGWHNRATVRAVGVADESGIVDFHIPQAKVPSSASLHQHGFRGLAGNLVQVPICTLDEELKDSPTVDLMKIDVEGFEPAVLRGAEAIIERDKPNIIVECNPDGPYREVSAFLSERDYQFVHLGADKDHMPTIVPDPSERFRNFLAQPKR